jgi:hypothetical protein
MARGAAKDVLIQLSAIVSGGGAQCLYPSLACISERATVGKP